MDEISDGLFQEVSQFMQKGINLEAKIKETGISIREQSKLSYGSDLLDARLNLLSIASFLFECRANKPGKTSENISSRLQLITIFLQGTNYMEDLISEGQYIKATAAIKQDYEILTRISAIKKNDDVYGKVPNVKNLPKEVRRFYGELNDVAHISKTDILNNLIFQKIVDEISGVSPFPVFIADIAKNLYELHLFLLVSIVREQIILLNEMYDDLETEMKKIQRFFIISIELLKKAGFIVE